MYVNGCIDPCQQFLQLTETEELRFIGPEDATGEEVDKFTSFYQFLSEVPAGAYAKQVNEGPVVTHNTPVGIGVRTDMDEESVYKITKAFWENAESISSDAPWAKKINIDYAVQDLANMPLHPGAARYYREAGVIK